MKRTITTIFSFFFLLTIHAQPWTDSEMHELYWKYRDQMKKYFMKIGIEDGESIPMTTNGLDYIPGGAPGSSVHWRDATIELGYYVATLATEYRLLKDNGQDVSSTANELFYALSALNRLDSKAVQYLSQDLSASLAMNGLLLRDDVNEDFWLNFQDDPSMDGSGPADINASRSAYNGMDEDGSVDYYSAGNVQSLDQLVTIMTGLVSVWELVDASETVDGITGVDNGPVHIRGMAKSIATRILQRLRSDDWLVLNWDGDLVPAGSSAQFSSVAFMKIAERMGISGVVSNHIPIKVSATPICEFLLGCDFFLPPEEQAMRQFALQTPGVPLWMADNCNECGEADIIDPLPNANLYFERTALNASWNHFEETGQPIKINGGDLLCARLNLTVDFNPPFVFPPPPPFHIPFSICLYKNDWMTPEGILFEEIIEEVMDKHNVHMFHELAIASEFWDTDYVHLNNSFNSPEESLPHLAMLSAVLNDNRSTSDIADQGFYKDILETAPCTSPWAFANGISPTAPGGWASPNRLFHPDFLYLGAHGSPTSQHSDWRGEYPGIDFMLMYNLYHLLWADQLPEYRDEVACDCVLDIPLLHPELALNPEGWSVSSEDFTLTKKFPDYDEKGITSPSFLRHDLRITNGSTFIIDNDLILCPENPGDVVRITVTDNSTLIVEEGRTLEMTEYGELIVEEGSSVILRGSSDSTEPSRLLFNEHSSLIINDSELITEDGAQLTLMDNSSMTTSNALIHCQNTLTYPPVFFLETGIGTEIHTASTELRIDDGYSIAFLNCDSEWIMDDTDINGGPSNILSDDIDIEGIESFRQTRILTHNSVITMEGESSLTDVDLAVYSIPEFEGPPAIVDLDGACQASRSRIFILSGGTTDLRDGDITLSDNSAIYLEKLSVGQWNEDTRLTLNGASSEFKIAGTIEMEANSVFNFDTDPGHTSGKVRIMDRGAPYTGQFIPATSNDCRIELIGQGINDAVLLIEGNAEFGVHWQEVKSRLAEIRIEDGKVEMNYGSTLNGIYASRMIFNDCRVQNGTVKTYEKNSFSDCIFTDNSHLNGLFNGQPGRKLYVYDSDFDDADITVDLGGLDLLRSDLEDTYVVLNNSTLPTNVRHCTFGRYSGVHQIGSASVLNLTNNDFFHKWTHLFFDGGDINMRCNYIAGEVNGAGRLNLSAAQKAGYNVFDQLDNTTTSNDLFIEDASTLILKDGFNTFVEPRGILLGGLSPVGGYPVNYNASNNNWEEYNPGSGPNTPGDAEGYFDAGPSGRVLVLNSGNQPPSTVPVTDNISNDRTACGSEDRKIKGLNAGIARPTSDDMAGLTKNLTDSVVFPMITLAGSGEMLLDSAVLSTMDVMEMYNDSTGDDLQAIDHFHRIYQYVDSAGFEDFDWVFEIVMVNLKATVENAFSHELIEMDEESTSFDPYTQKYVEVLMLATADVVDSTNYEEQFDLELDKAHLFNMIGRKQMSWQLLTNLDNCPIDSAEQSRLNKWIYDLEHQILLLQYNDSLSLNDTLPTQIDTTLFNFPSPIDAEEFYFGAHIIDIDQVKYTNCDLITWKALHGEKEDDFLVFPNPSTGVFSILYLRETDEQVEFRLMDMNGRLMDVVALNGKEGLVQVDQSRLARGSYSYSFISNDGILDSGTLIKD